MSGLWGSAMLAGGAVGAGLAIFLYVVAVPRRPALAALLDRAGSRPDLLPVTAVVKERTWRVEASERLVEVLTKLPPSAPARDLAIVEKTRSAFLLERAGLALVGLLAVPMFSIILWALGAGLPPAIPVLVTIGLTGGLYMLPGIRVKAAADSRRREMRYAMVEYMTAVAMHRAAGAGASMSLELAAAASRSWSFRRIDRQIPVAQRANRPIWDSLADLAVELDIHELADLSSIVETGGVMGAKIGETLLARAASLRHELLAKELAEAAEATNRMAFPKTLLGGVIALFVLFPPLYSLASGGGIG